MEGDTHLRRYNPFNGWSVWIATMQVYIGPKSVATKEEIIRSEVWISDSEFVSTSHGVSPQLDAFPVYHVSDFRDVLTPHVASLSVAFPPRFAFPVHHAALSMPRPNVPTRWNVSQ